MALPPEMLARPAAEGARAVALARLADARVQAGRLGAPGDGEALHDLRVAVRRARSTLRAWRDLLGPPVRDKDLRRLRRAVRATGAARDAEVLAAWLEGASSRLSPLHRPAALWLRERTSARAAARDLAPVARRIAEVSDRLTHRLRRAAPARGGPSFALAFAGRIREHVATLEAAVARVETRADLPAAHRARIAGKRLRYLLEPLRDVPGVASHEALRALRRLQDLLGDLNDAGAALEVVREAVREADPEAEDLLPGLAALEAAASRRVARLFARLRREVLPPRGADVLAPALAVAGALEAVARKRERGPRPVKDAGAGPSPGAHPEGSRSAPAAAPAARRPRRAAPRRPRAARPRRPAP